MNPHYPKTPVAATLAVSLLAISACAGTVESVFSIDQLSYSPDRATHLKLPKVLREVSGLALDEDDRLYAHDDERGIIYRIDYETGRVIERFALEGGIKADFEGIAAIERTLYLITSTGELYELRIGRADEVVPFQLHAEGLPCEVEGLSRAADGRSLLAACKNLADGGRDVHIYQWPLQTRRWSPVPAIKIQEPQWIALFESCGLKPPKKIQPTGLTLTPSGNLLIIAGRQHLLLEFDPDGEPLGLAQIPEERHRQAEGVSITRDGHLLIADEGDSKGSKKSRGMLSIYEPAR